MKQTKRFALPSFLPRENLFIHLGGTGSRSVLCNEWLVWFKTSDFCFIHTGPSPNFPLDILAPTATFITSRKGPIKEHYIEVLESSWLNQGVALICRDSSVSLPSLVRMLPALEGTTMLYSTGSSPQEALQGSDRVPSPASQGVT